jgi:hypothetical protein
MLVTGGGVLVTGGGVLVTGGGVLVTGGGMLETLVVTTCVRGGGIVDDETIVKIP